MHFKNQYVIDGDNSVQPNSTRIRSVQCGHKKKQIDVNFVIYSNWTIYEGKWSSKRTARATCVRM